MEMLMDIKEIMVVWNIVMTFMLGTLGFFLKEKFTELQRLTLLLNKTREEIARETVTKSELAKIQDHIDQRFNKLEDKINQLIAR
jgi:hypothetical protein